MEPAPFERFGTHHVAALVAVGLAAGGLSMLVRLDRGGRLGRTVRFGLVALLVTLTVLTLAAPARAAALTVWDFLPLHLCDFLILLAMYALITRHRLACELLYFWASTGTLLAMVTPDLGVGFPDWRFLSFFGLHGAVVTSAAVLSFGLREAPRRHAAWRAFLLLNVYAGIVGAVNQIWGTNFLFLCGKPMEPTLLDALGPWPVYLIVADVAALGLFLLLDRVLRAITKDTVL